MYDSAGSSDAYAAGSTLSCRIGHPFAPSRSIVNVGQWRVRDGGHFKGSFETRGLLFLARLQHGLEKSKGKNSRPRFFPKTRGRGVIAHLLFLEIRGQGFLGCSFTATNRPPVLEPIAKTQENPGPVALKNWAFRWKPFCWVSSGSISEARRPRISLETSPTQSPIRRIEQCRTVS